MATAINIPHTTNASGFLSGGGVMGELMRNYEWEKSPLGAPQTWPATLKTTLRLLLTSNHPMLIWWGPELIQFYNDAYRHTMDTGRHPRALGQRGRECWGEIWTTIGPQIEYVMSGRGATWHEEQLLQVVRHSELRNEWWTYGFSPIEDDAGVHGVLVVCNDVTEQHKTRERLQQLNRQLETEIEQRKQAEARLAVQHQVELNREQARSYQILSFESENRKRFYETFLSHTPDLAYVFDLNHRFIYANTVLLKMWGKTWEEAIGKNCLELGYEPWHAEMHDREIEQVIATKQPVRGEVPFNGTFGRRIYDYIFVPVFGADGEVEVIAGTTRDVTER
ncbi:MAG TPA: PAS domain-containing protein, partial [Cellvibrio sp.]